MKTASQLLGLINGEITNLYKSRTTQSLYLPAEYILSLGGKRFRPILVLLVNQLREPDRPVPVRAALSVEVFHNFSLMHDDIMDNAPLRRGQQTVHQKWNDSTAILSGDAMLVHAYQLLENIPEELAVPVYHRFGQMAMEVCEGQQLDMDFEKRSTVPEAEYLEMIRLKTAVLLGFSMELGAILGGFDRSAKEKFREIGESLGIGFQLMDDYLDVFGDQQKVGKQKGGDILANKKTYLLIKALAKAGDAQLEQLKSWLNHKQPNPTEKVDAIVAIYDKLGIQEEVKSKMEAYFTKAISGLNSISMNEEAKGIMLDFINQFVNRES